MVSVSIFFISISSPGILYIAEMCIDIWSFSLMIVSGLVLRLISSCIIYRLTSVAVPSLEMHLGFEGRFV